MQFQIISVGLSFSHALAHVVNGGGNAFATRGAWEFGLEPFMSTGVCQGSMRVALDPGISSKDKTLVVMPYLVLEIDSEAGRPKSVTNMPWTPGNGDLLTNDWQIGVKTQIALPYNENLGNATLDNINKDAEERILDGLVNKPAASQEQETSPEEEVKKVVIGGEEISVRGISSVNYIRKTIETAYGKIPMEGLSVRAIRKALEGADQDSLLVYCFEAGGKVNFGMIGGVAMGDNGDLTTLVGPEVSKALKS